ISARVAVAEIGAGSVTERVTARRSANRTRTDTVRPSRDLALSREPTRSARWRKVGRKTLAAAGFLPRADCAPADRARRGVLISRGSRFEWPQRHHVEFGIRLLDDVAKAVAQLGRALHRLHAFRIIARPILPPHRPPSL